MKAESTIRKEIRALRKYAETDGDAVGARIAWCVEHALRWAIEDVNGWPNRVVDVQQTANLIRRDAEQGRPMKGTTMTTQEGETYQKLIAIAWIILITILLAYSLVPKVQECFERVNSVDSITQVMKR